MRIITSKCIETTRQVGTKDAGNWFFHGTDTSISDYAPIGEMDWTAVGPESVCKKLTIKSDEVLVQPIAKGTFKITGKWNGETATLSIEVVE